MDEDELEELVERKIDEALDARAEDHWLWGGQMSWTATFVLIAVMAVVLKVFGFC